MSDTITNTLEAASSETLLPDEIWLAVFGYLGPRDLANVQRGCMKWSLLTCDNTLWRPLLAAVAMSIPDPAALAMGDYPAGIAIKDVYACRILRSRHADTSVCAPPAIAYASRGVAARRHPKSGMLLCGRFDQHGRLQGYGESDVLWRDGKGKTSVATYRGVFCNGVYHGRGALTVECRTCAQWDRYDCPLYAYKHAVRGGALNVLTVETLNGHTRVSFSGEFAGGLADGFGCATYYTKGGDLHAEYKGAWERGRWHGYGRADSVNGDYCEGNFAQGRPDDNVCARCVEPTPYRFEGCVASGSDQVLPQITFDDGTRLVVDRSIAPLGLVHATMHAPDGTVYADGTWDNGHGHATDPRANRRLYARFHRFIKPCDVAVTDRHGRVWHGCTGGCFGKPHHNPRGLQEIVYPNGDVLAVRWDDRLESVLSFSVSPNCPDARFAGATIRECEWRHSRVGEPHGGRSDEWVFEPHRRYTAQRERFLAYVRSGLGPWSPAALRVYGWES